MMLDMKRTFDEVVEPHADPARAEAILANPFYQSLSSSLRRHAGVHGDGEARPAAQPRPRTAAQPWDLIVVDTPPSRSALDFLDAPQAARLVPRRAVDPHAAGAGEGRRSGVHASGARRRASGAFTGVLSKLLGAELLHDLQTSWPRWTRCSAASGERADATYELLQAAGTAFLVVAAPEPDALREASYFVERLGRGRHAAGRAGAQPGARAAPRTPCRRTAAWPPPRSSTRPATTRSTAGLLRLHAERMQQDRDASEHLRARASPRRTRDVAGRAGLPALPSDVHDLDGLRDASARHCARTASPGRQAPAAADRREAGASAGQPATGMSAARARSPTAPSRAAARQDVTFGRRRSSARRSRSVIPPQTPNSTRLSRASARHSVRTGQPMQTAFARFCAAPWTNSVSGSVPRQAARAPSRSVQPMCRKVRKQTSGATGPNGPYRSGPDGLWTSGRVQAPDRAADRGRGPASCPT